MKTKLFYLFIAVFLFSFSGKSQTYPTITLIGSGNGGWTDTAETPLLTSDGITYSLVDKVLTDGELKFREGKCWTTGCAPTVTNTFGWGPTDAQFTIDGGWPSGTNATPADGGKNIVSKAGVWTITFDRINGTWSFVPGTPLPVIKLVGTSVSAAGGASLTTADGIIFTAKKVTLVPGTCQFSIDAVLAGGLTFPTGDALSPTDMIPVNTTGIDYDVTFDYSLYKYTFTVATFPGISIVGDGTGVDGWPGQANNPGPIDVHQMTTNDGVTYTLNNLPIVPGQLLFRTNNGWDVKYGDAPFPTGSGNGANNIVVPAGNAGTYNVTLNANTKAYAFTKITYSIVGTGVGGWPGETGNPGPIDNHQLSTVDGVNYTSTGLVVIAGGAKFRLNNAWAGGDWGGDGFPAGTKTGNNIPTVAGTYNLTVNVLTGAYDFGTALAVTKFDTKSFKAYPNPTKGSWNITSNDEITSVQVYDVQGKAVYTKFGASKEVSVNASELSKGVYFAKVATANGESTLKLVKE
ncbi:T9SS type A sorting domain-containing protein [Flavobacterium franklandianum]|uniref:T9SS type A sorting domain-containing protein n=1 Tax=Flavobacterium franklandianum TaxID=2594430 RepID=A0A553CKR0_9FLAO|nr:T9SS type A sorting domain-containing protein [Flavobacterium franklandianum]TRX21037.1 T9SS type A sorting domain-containing protein [Flavobacterium franklandianum]